MGKALVSMFVGAGIVLSATTAFAGQLVYTPTNPTFGGNPLNGSFLLQQAQTQGHGPQSGQASPTINFPANFFNSNGTANMPTTP
jgi:curli production assembly/transport component CsgF